MLLVSICGIGPPRFENVRWRGFVKNFGPAGFKGFGVGFLSVAACIPLGPGSGWPLGAGGSGAGGMGCVGSLLGSAVSRDLRIILKCSSSESLSGAARRARVWADVPSPGSNAGGSGSMTPGLLCWRVTRCVGSGCLVLGPGRRPGGGGDGGISSSRSSKFSVGSAFS